MCGIAGIVGFGSAAPPERAALERMIDALSHRGPDEAGLYVDRCAGMAHARLSIIDLQTGQQPLGSVAGDCWIVFNGEVFNYVELRAELEARGHAFRTRSDTEVVVCAWREWGVGAFERFVGQWACALWDAPRRRLVLSRDRLGICPLHYAEHAGRVVFGSEVKALFAGEPDLPRALDPVGLAETLTFWTVVPPQSVFRGVRELEPGHVRIYEADGVRDQAWYTPRYEPAFDGTPAEAGEAVRAALDAATSLRMLRSDVPVGSYLSGGLDSSLLAALARRHAGDDSLTTFSIRFRDAEFDETSFQHMMAERLGAQHHEVMIGPRDIAEIFPRVIRHTERPILRTAPAPLMILSRAVRERGQKVVLTGEGADEVFAGYDLFREGKVRRFWARRPDSTLRPRLLERLYPYLKRSPVAHAAMARRFFGRDLERALEPGFSHGPRWRTGAGLTRLLTPDVRAAASGANVVQRLLADLPAAFDGWSPLAQDQYLEVRTLLSGYLLSSQGDRMLLSSSVEGRFPYLDHRVVALGGRLPDTYKLPGLAEKDVLKRAAERLVPAAIVRRKKQPYRAPDAAAFVLEGAPEWIDEVASPRAVAEAGVFDPALVGRLLGKCRALAPRGRLSNADDMALVGVLSTQLLHSLLVAQAPPLAPAAPTCPMTVIDRSIP